MTDIDNAVLIEVETFFTYNLHACTLANCNSTLIVFSKYNAYLCIDICIFTTVVQPDFSHC